MARARNQPSSIERLPPEIQDELKRLRTRLGFSIEEMIEWLRTQGQDDVSRSAMGRYCRKLHLTVEKAAEKINRSQAISTALVERFGDKTDNELARLNIQLLQGQVLDMIMEEDRAEEDGDEEAAKGDPLKLLRLSKTVQQLLSAEKMNAEMVKLIREEGRKEERERAAAALEEGGKRGDLDPEALARAKRIMGYD